jgi:hypothetical protein
MAELQRLPGQLTPEHDADEPRLRPEGDGLRFSAPARPAQRVMRARRPEQLPAPATEPHGVPPVLSSGWLLVAAPGLSPPARLTAPPPNESLERLAGDQASSADMSGLERAAGREQSVIDRPARNAAHRSCLDNREELWQRRGVFALHGTPRGMDPLPCGKEYRAHCARRRFICSMNRAIVAHSRAQRATLAHASSRGLAPACPFLRTPHMKVVLERGLPASTARLPLPPPFRVPLGFAGRYRAGRLYPTSGLGLEPHRDAPRLRPYPPDRSRVDAVASGSRVVWTPTLAHPRAQVKGVVAHAPCRGAQRPTAPVLPPSYRRTPLHRHAQPCIGSEIRTRAKRAENGRL